MTLPSALFPILVIPSGVTRRFFFRPAWRDVASRSRGTPLRFCGSGLEVLHFLMDQHGLKQKDLADVFGTPSIVSEVLTGKRQLNKHHIQRLSRRYHVSPELFF